MVSITKGTTGHYVPTQTSSNMGVYRAAIPASVAMGKMQAVPHMSISSGQQMSMSQSSNLPQKGSFTGYSKMSTSYAP